MSVSFHTSCPLSSEPLSPSFYEIDLIYNKSVFTPNQTNKKLYQSVSHSSPANSDKELLCCICGTCAFLQTCEKKNCSNKFHLHCLTYFFPELLSPTKVCPGHSFKHLKDCSKLLHYSLHLNSSAVLYEIIKSQKSLKKNTTLAGCAFWFGISQQYFPYFNLSRPIFFEPKMSFQPLEEKSWVSAEIFKASQEISKNNENLQSIFDAIQVKSKNFSKNPKIGENLENCFRIPVHQSGKLIRKYEQIQLKTYDFHSKYEGRSIIKEEKALCSICEKLDSKKSNVILTCENCSVSVHSKCYQVHEIGPQWLCDNCKLHPMTKKSCYLCPVTKGALKIISPNTWVHVTCARYLQNFYSNDEELDIRKIDKEKFKLKCFSCGIKAGACIQCCQGRCANAFHVECRKDLLEETGSGCYWLCPVHKASKLTRFYRSRQDEQLEFIKEISGIFWNKCVGEKEHIKRKYNKKKNCEKNRVVVEIKEGVMTVKFFSGSKLVRVMKFVEEGGKKIGCEDNEAKKVMSLKKRKDASGFTVLENHKGDLEVMMTIPSECFEDKAMKILKRIDFN